MPLQSPVLDDRTFQQLVDEAKARIPRFTPEWTNFNTSDPGFTLVQLHAWLTETILYRLNKLPDLNYSKFLDLLNVRPRPAVAAQAQLSFKLKKLNGVNDPLVVLIPKSTQVGVDDPDLEEELLFETDRTLTALNGVLAAIITPANTVTTSRELVTEYDAKTTETKLKGAFYPFGKSPTGDEVCLLGIVLRPNRQKGKDYSLDRFPEGELDLTALIPQVFEEDADDVLITGPSGIHCLFPWQVQAQSQGIVWEAYNGIGHATDFEDDDAWIALNVFDETAALARSGHVYLNVPGARPAVAFSALSRAFWESIDLKKSPSSRNELITDITNQELIPADLDEDAWKAMGLTGADLSALLTLIGDPDTTLAAITAKLATLTIDPSKVDQEVWTDLDYSAQPVPHKVTWFRVRLAAKPENAPEVSHFLLNTVAASFRTPASKRSSAIATVAPTSGTSSAARPF